MTVRQYKPALADITPAYPNAIFSPSEVIDDIGIIDDITESFNVPATAPYVVQLNRQLIESLDLEITIDGVEAVLDDFDAVTSPGKANVSFAMPLIKFDESDAGKPVTLTAKAIGTPIGALDLNTIQAEIVALEQAISVATSPVVVVDSIATNDLQDWHTYIADGVTKVVFKLPTAPTIGARYEIIGRSSNGWELTQNAGQTIYDKDVSTTTGTAGSISSSHHRNSIVLRCTAANEFTVTSTNGVLTYV